MENTSSRAELKDLIQLLELQQAIEGELLKEQFYLTYDSLKPVNLLKSTISEAVSFPILFNNILGTAVGLATGYVSKKIIVGTSGNLFRKLLGFAAQLGVTNTVAQHPGAIRSTGQFIYQYLLNKIDVNFKGRDK
jgi:hypothetical protein